MNASAKVPREVLDQLTNTSSWFWTYALKPEPVPLQWGIDNKKEFGLVNLKKVLPTEYGQCSFDEENCTVGMLTRVLNDSMKQITVRYLMGHNVPYASHHEDSSYGKKGLKGVNGAQGTYWWRVWIQPAAQQLGLKLVSPTTGISEQKAAWMIEFLKACYDSRDDPRNPCKVELVEVFSVHEYKCYERFWLKYAAEDGGESVSDRIPGCPKHPGDFRFSQNGAEFKPAKETNIFTNMRAAMKQHYGEQAYNDFWGAYFDGVELWVMETSRSGDYT